MLRLFPAFVREEERSHKPGVSWVQNHTTFKYRNSPIGFRSNIGWAAWNWRWISDFFSRAKKYVAPRNCVLDTLLNTADFPSLPPSCPRAKGSFAAVYWVAISFSPLPPLATVAEGNFSILHPTKLRPTVQMKVVSRKLMVSHRFFTSKKAFFVLTEKMSGRVLALRHDRRVSVVIMQ